MPTLSLTAAANVAAQYLGILDSGESLSTTQLNDALAIANQLLDSWSSDPKKIVQLYKATWSMTANVQSYTIGPGLLVPVPSRPVMIVSAAFLNAAGPGGPIKVISGPEWSAIPNRQRVSWIIEALFYDRYYPTGVVYVSPVPQGTLTGELLVWLPFTSFANVGTAIDMLPSYSRLLITSLAKELAPQYGVEPSGTLLSDYQEATSIVEALNASLFGSLTDEQKALIATAGK